MSSEDFCARLQAAIARHVGAPGTIHDLQRLTGGANKTTWSFDADVAGTPAAFILQLASPRANDESNPLAGVLAASDRRGRRATDDRGGESRRPGTSRPRDSQR